MAPPEKSPTRHPAWLAYALVAAAVAMLVMMLVPVTPDSAITGPSIAQPAQQTLEPSAP